MKICSSSFMRDGVKLGYPFKESIRSVLPICNEFNPDYQSTRRENKRRFLARMENLFGWDFSKQHFEVIREYE